MTAYQSASALRAALICDWNGPHTGIGRYWRALHGALLEAGVDAVQVMPLLPRVPDAVHDLLTVLGRDLDSFLTNYPLWCRYPKAEIYHLAQQGLASLLFLRRPRGKVIITVHDIFPHLLRRDAWFALATAGLSRADHLIAISEYTKRSVVEELGLAPESITVVHHGIDHARFRPMTRSNAVREQYRLPEGRRFLIYVGTEDPRKNLPALVRALAHVRRECPEIELIKVGRSHSPLEREALVRLAGQLGVLRAIHFLEDVRDEDLPQLYALAELYVTPSLYEGFGFPLLEAMACGTPTVYADAGSLPEIAADAGVAVSRCSGEGLGRTLLEVLADPERRTRMRSAGLARAARFTWAAAGRAVRSVYEAVLRGTGVDRGDHAFQQPAEPGLAAGNPERA